MHCVLLKFTHHHHSALLFVHSSTGGKHLLLPLLLVLSLRGGVCVLPLLEGEATLVSRKHVGVIRPESKEK